MPFSKHSQGASCVFDSEIGAMDTWLLRSIAIPNWGVTKLYMWQMRRGTNSRQNKQEKTFVPGCTVGVKHYAEAPCVMG